MNVLYPSVKYPKNTPKFLHKIIHMPLHKARHVCILSARNGGAYVKSIKEQHKLHQKSKGKTKEGANDPLTDGDLYSNIAMIKTIRNFFPNIPIVSEEQFSAKDVKIDLKLPQIPKISKEFVSQSDIAIWIDPLDATQEYTEDLLEYVTTMVCVAVKGRPIMGVIYKPFQTPALEENTYWGWVNHTYSPNLDDLKSNNNHITPSDINTDSEKELHPRNEPSIKVLVSRSHPGNINSVAQQILTKELLNSNSKSKLIDLNNQAAAEENDKNSNIRIIPAGGAGYKVLELLNGHAQYYLHTTYIKKWDICAGNALLDTLGGTLTDINGQRIEYFGPEINNYKKENENSNEEKNSPFEVLLKTGLIARAPIQHRF